jgi:DNA-binding response OmpR family regulator
MKSTVCIGPVTPDDIAAACPTRPANDLPAGNVFTFACGDVDLGKGEIRFKDGCRSRISRQECELLRHLSRKRGACVSRDEILAEVWQLNPLRVRTRTIDMHVSMLRRKLRDDARNPSVVMTISGRGYMVV